MYTIKYLVTAALLHTLISCGVNSENTEKKGAISDAHLKAIERAQSVEKILLDAEQTRQKTMKEQGI